MRLRVERYESIVAVVLAAGEGTRLKGHVKQLLPWGKESLIRRSIAQALEAGFGSVFVVLGYRAKLIEREISDMPAEIVMNEEWEEGIASSVRTAVKRLPPTVEAVLFLPVDQPGITSSVLKRVTDAFLRSGKPIAYAEYDGTPKQPAIFARSMFPELLSLKGDSGGRIVVGKHPEDSLAVKIDVPFAGQDIDTWEDYIEMLAQHGMMPNEEG